MNHSCEALFNQSQKECLDFFFNEFSSMSKAVLSEGCLGGRWGGIGYLFDGRICSINK